MQSKRIFVFASTGDQGKSVCFTLARAGYQVTGLTRNTEGRVAKGESIAPGAGHAQDEDSQWSPELDQAGVNMVKGDLDNPESYKRYLKDQDAVYLNADGESRDETRPRYIFNPPPQRCPVALETPCRSH